MKTNMEMKKQSNRLKNKLKNGFNNTCKKINKITRMVKIQMKTLTIDLCILL